MDEVAEERTDVKVGKVNVDEQPELASQFGVMSIPTLLVFQMCIRDRCWLWKLLTARLRRLQTS